MRGEMGVGLLGAWLAFGCGETSHNAAGSGGGRPAVAQGGSSSSSGGAAEAGSGTVAAGGSAPMPAVCDRRSADGIATDPEVTGRYRWSECGRINATARPRQAFYGGDGSILVFEDGGRVIAYSPDAISPAVLIAKTPSAQTTDAADQGVALSSDMKIMVAWSSLTAQAYRSASGGPIEASSGELEPLPAIDLAQAGCSGPLRFSADSTSLVALGADSACIWSAESGELTAKVPLPAMAADAPRTVGLASGAAPLRLFHDGWLSSYRLDGEQDAHLEVESTKTGAFTLSLDAETLLFIAGDGALVAVDSGNASERWRQPSQESYGPIVTSNDGYVLVKGGHVYGISDGTEVAKDTPSPNGSPSALAPGGVKKLMVDEQVGEWDLAEQRSLRLYGGHSKAVTSLDVSRDGKFFASHGARAVVWEVAAEFSQSKPLFGGAYSSTWYVALSPQGDAMVADGDNGAYFRRDGSFVKVVDGVPPSVSCPSADWAFSHDGALVAGNWYGRLLVRDGRSFAQLKALGSPEEHCGVGMAFSPDGKRLMTSELALFDTSDWSLLRGRTSADSGYTPGSYWKSSIAYSPSCEEVVRTQCAESSQPPCGSARYDASTGALLGELADFAGSRSYYSPDGHFLVSNERLYHIPSGASSAYAERVSSAMFTVDGEIIAGQADGSLVRYCRTSE